MCGCGGKVYCVNMGKMSCGASIVVWIFSVFRLEVNHV